MTLEESSTESRKRSKFTHLTQEEREEFSNIFLLMLLSVAIYAVDFWTLWLVSDRYSISDILAIHLKAPMIFVQAPLLMFLIPILAATSISIFSFVSLVWILISEKHRQPWESETEVERGLEWRDFYDSARRGYTLVARFRANFRLNIVSLMVSTLFTLSVGSYSRWQANTVVIVGVGAIMIGMFHYGLSRFVVETWAEDESLSARERIATASARARKRFLVEILIGQRLPQS